MFGLFGKSKAKRDALRPNCPRGDWILAWGREAGEPGSLVRRRFCYATLGAISRCRDHLLADDPDLVVAWNGATDWAANRGKNRDLDLDWLMTEATSAVERAQLRFAATAEDVGLLSALAGSTDKAMETTLATLQMKWLAAAAAKTAFMTFLPMGSSDFEADGLTPIHGAAANAVQCGAVAVAAYRAIDRASAAQIRAALSHYNDPVGGLVRELHAQDLLDEEMLLAAKAVRERFPWE